MSVQLETEIDKYSTEFIRELITKGDEVLKEQTKDLFRINDKSYVILGMYLTVEGFCFVNLMTNSSNDHLYQVLGYAMLLPITLILFNIFPGTFIPLGQDPSKAADPNYYPKIKKEDQLHAYLKYRLLDFQENIDKNDKELKRRHGKLIASVVSASVIVLLAFFLASWSSFDV